MYLSQATTYETVTKSDGAKHVPPDNVDTPRVCPYCPDKLRDGADVRSARSNRRSA